MTTREEREEWQRYAKNLSPEEQAWFRESRPDLYEEPKKVREYVKKPYVYMIACPDFPWWSIREARGDLIDDLQEISIPVTYKTMQRHCEGLADWLLWKGVVTDRHGMVKALEQSDWVAFKKSFYDGIPCYFVDWSGIEFIWMLEEALEALEIEPRVPPWEVEKLAEMGLEPVDPRTEHLPDFPGIDISKVFWRR